MSKIIKNIDNTLVSHICTALLLFLGIMLLGCGLALAGAEKEQPVIMYLGMALMTFGFFLGMHIDAVNPYKKSR